MTKREDAKPRFHSVNVYADDFRKIDELCTAMKMKKCVLIQKILEGVYDAGSEFIGQPEMGILIDSRGRNCQIIFYGRSAIVLAVGQTDEACKKLTEDEFNKRKREKENE